MIEYHYASGNIAALWFVDGSVNDGDRHDIVGVQDSAEILNDSNDSKDEDDRSDCSD